MVFHENFLHFKFMVPFCCIPPTHTHTHKGQTIMTFYLFLKAHKCTSLCLNQSENRSYRTSKHRSKNSLLWYNGYTKARVTNVFGKSRFMWSRKDYHVEVFHCTHWKYKHTHNRLRILEKHYYAPFSYNKRFLFHAKGVFHM